MSRAAHTLEGWFVLHDFRTIDWTAWKALSEEERHKTREELLHFIHTWDEVEKAKQGSFGLFAVNGHKADLLFIHLRPTLEELNEVETQFDKSRFAELLSKEYSYVSVVELGGYLAPPGADIANDPEIQARLKPILPKTRHVCFYPMNKKREGQDNWYMLSPEERKELMRSHGQTGRKYAGRVTQIISGSMGLDDWEWGVTLFSDDPVQFKKIVQEMRFDEVSARFGEFGPFFVGTRLTEERLENYLKV